MLLNIEELQKDLDKTLEHFNYELKKFKTGRASLDLIENIHVNVYGGPMQLSSVGQIFIKDAVTIEVNVWDKSILPTVDKSLREANLGASISIDRDLIRLKFNPITTEDREKKIKELMKFVEEMRIRIRLVRQEYNKQLQSMEGVSEDDLKASQNSLQKIIDQHIKIVEDLSKKKESEIMKI